MGHLELEQACTAVLLELGILVEMLAAQYLLQLSMPGKVDSIEMVTATAVGAQLGQDTVLVVEPVMAVLQLSGSTRPVRRIPQ